MCVSITCGLGCVYLLPPGSGGSNLLQTCWQHACNIILQILSLFEGTERRLSDTLQHPEPSRRQPAACAYQLAFSLSSSPCSLGCSASTLGDLRSSSKPCHAPNLENALHQPRFTLSQPIPLCQINSTPTPNPPSNPEPPAPSVLQLAPPLRQERVQLLVQLQHRRLVQVAAVPLDGDLLHVPGPHRVGWLLV